MAKKKTDNVEQYRDELNAEMGSKGFIVDVTPFGTMYFNKDPKDTTSVQCDVENAIKTGITPRRMATILASSLKHRPLPRG